jgi:radical SAM protein with 4Fe4S-binding SPASM domain
MKRSKGMMRLEDFIKIIDCLGPYLLYAEFQNWGEPLLHKDIYKMVSYAKNFGVYTLLSTNFQYFDKNSAEAMVNSKLDRLIVSIDGISQESYEKYRRGGDFCRAVENIKILINKKKKMKSRLPFVTWQYLVFRHNEGELSLAKKIADEVGVDQLAYSSAFIAVDSAEYRDWLPIQERYRRYDLTKEFNVSAGASSFLKPSMNVICNWPWQAIVVNWDGSVSPCCGVFLEEDDFGNFFSQCSFKKLWNNSNYQTARYFLRDRQSKGLDSKNTCVRCPFIGHINIDLTRVFGEQ